ncbi:MAG: murein biosynthesis integral membrane protein MurJ [Phototrophicaceae bacterium]
MASSDSSLPAPAPPNDVPANEPTGQTSGGLLRSVGVISLLTGISRVLGLARDVLLAAFFFGPLLDAFLLAFTVPNLFRRLFGEGALSAAFVPVMVERVEEDRREETDGRLPRASALASAVLSFLTASLGVIAAAGIAIFLLLSVIGVFDETGILTARLLAVMLPYMVLICAAALLMGALNSLGHFAAPAAAPPLLNIILIGAIVVLAVWPRPLGDEQSTWVYGLALAVLVGGAAQLLLQVPFLLRRGVRLYPRWAPRDEPVRRVGRALGPVVLGLAVFQVNVLFDRLIAMWLVPEDGAVSVLFLGNRLVQLPLALFAVALGTVALPHLSGLVARGKHRAAQDGLARLLQLLFFMVAPAGVGLALISEPLVQLLFGHGELGNTFGAVDRAARVVQYYSMGLAGFSGVILLSRAFYAKGDTVTPMRIALLAVAANLILNLILVHFLAESGLALASSLSSLLQMALLALLLFGSDTLERVARPGWQRSAVITLGAFAAGVAGALIIYYGIVPAVADRLNALFDVQPGERNELLLKARLLFVQRIAATQGGTAVFCAAVFGLIASFHGTKHARETAMRVVKIALTVVPLGVLVHWFVWSLPPTGDTIWVPLQRVAAPVIVGVLGYWFLGGLVQLREYELVRATVKRWRGGESLREAAVEQMGRKETEDASP